MIAGFLGYKDKGSGKASEVAIGDGDALSMASMMGGGTAIDDSEADDGFETA